MTLPPEINHYRGWYFTICGEGLIQTMLFSHSRNPYKPSRKGWYAYGPFDSHKLAVHALACYIATRPIELCEANWKRRDEGRCTAPYHMLTKRSNTAHISDPYDLFGHLPFHKKNPEPVSPGP